jgi:hypothetical protein
MVLTAFHETLTALPKVLIERFKDSVSDKALTARIKEDVRHKTPEFWQWFFNTVKQNNHWMGGNQSGWKADFHWLMKRSNFDKVLERGANNG